MVIFNNARSTRKRRPAGIRTAVCLFFAAAHSMFSQTITGTIQGSVRDSSGQAIAKAPVVLKQTETGRQRAAETSMQGDFLFGSLEPGTYSVAISAQGFKTLEKTGIPLSSSETVSVGELTLEIGEVTQRVLVEAQGAAVQTASSERSGLVTGSQAQNLTIRGRNVMDLLQILPGVVNQANNEALNRNWNLNVLGGRQASNNLTLDGLTNVNMGNNFNSPVTVSLDAVEEVKALTGNYQAQYGRMSGANIQIITKSGTRQFHGLASYFKRHEQFNANNFFSNQIGLAKPIYRYNTWTYNIGGPIYMPGKLAKMRDKLFFFWSQEFWPLKTAGAVVRLTVPTALERTGDFSQSVDQNGALIVVRDPATGQPLQGNRAAANQLNASGLALLKTFPSPNFNDISISARRYNYIFQNQQTTPLNTSTLKLDYLISSKDHLTASMTFHNETIRNLIDNAWPQVVRDREDHNKGVIFRHERIFSPRWINEASFGFVRRPEDDTLDAASIQRYQRSAIGFTAGQLHPENNPLSLIPNATFGGVVSPASLTISPLTPFHFRTPTWMFTDNISHQRGRHLFKAGVYWDRLPTTSSTAGVNFNGAFDFSTNANNPLDTRYAYANAALGFFNQYSEPSANFPLSLHAGGLEWYAQDSWKVSNRLTVEIGMRFQWIPPTYEENGHMSGFVPDRFNPSQAARLIAPTLVGGVRMGVDPVTGQTYPQNLIGAIAPSSRNTANGMVNRQTDPNYPKALVDDRGVQYGPRIGFAYDPFGKGKTAIRSGFGVFYNRPQANITAQAFSTQPPLVTTPIVTFGSIPTLLGAAGFVLPQNVLGASRPGKIPSVMNFSFAVQQSIGFGTVVDVAYVGALGRHLLWQRNLNAVPFGADFNPANADTTNRGLPLPVNFLRPYIGYANINEREFASSSNYNSLQVSANRRFAKGLQFGFAWTWSKSLDYNSDDTEIVSSLIPVRVWNYSVSSFDRTHIVKVNWLWDVPSPARSGWAKAVTGGWQIAGITTFQSGAPLPVNLTTTAAVDITGSPTDLPRVVITGNPKLPDDQRTFSRNFNTGVFQLPATGTFGNAPRFPLRGPGLNNWDTVLFKNFPIRERMRLQLRWELYNAFNHTQFTALDTTARFDPRGQQVNAGFGQFTAAANPRIMQFAIRFLF